MIASGVKVEVATRGMSGALSQYLIDAIDTGTKIPVAMQPILAKMIELGLITDEAARKMLGLAADTMPSCSGSKAPTPPRISLSAPAISRGCDDDCASTPRYRSMLSTDPRFPRP